MEWRCASLESQMTFECAHSGVDEEGEKERERERTEGAGDEGNTENTHTVGGGMRDQ